MFKISWINVEIQRYFKIYSNGFTLAITFDFRPCVFTRQNPWSVKILVSMSRLYPRPTGIHSVSNEIFLWNIPLDCILILKQKEESLPYAFIKFLKLFRLLNSNLFKWKFQNCISIFLWNIWRIELFFNFSSLIKLQTSLNLVEIQFFLKRIQRKPRRSINSFNCK